MHSINADNRTALTHARTHAHAPHRAHSINQAGIDVADNFKSGHPLEVLVYLTGTRGAYAVAKLAELAGDNRFAKSGERSIRFIFSTQNNPNTM